MDVIKQLMEGGAAALAKILTGKSAKRDNEIVIVHEALTASEIRMLLNALVSEGNINDAENLLFDYMEKEPSEDLYHAGVNFFDRIEQFTDSELEGFNYSREEIAQGREDLSQLRPDWFLD